MAGNDQLDFTVTPYDDERSALVEPARRAAGPALLPSVLWAAAAVLAVGANFLLVYRIQYHADFGDGAPVQDLSFGFNGWGQNKILSSSDGPDVGSFGSGARWGWAFTTCAALLLTAAVWSAVRPGLRFRLLGASELALAGLFGLIGSITGLVLSFQPTVHQLRLDPDSPSRFHWGGCWPVEAVAFVVGLIGWLWHRQLASASEPAESESAEDAPVTSWDGPEPGDSDYLETGNWIGDATGRPGTPRDPGPSPW